MAFRVFLSYSLDPAEMALAWRLQTLAAAHAIEMYVPQHGAGTAPPGAVTVVQAIDRADCVLAIITTSVSEMVQSELAYALEHREEALNYAMQFARDMDTELADKVVGMYVNSWTLSYGERGRAAVQELLDRGFDAGLIPGPVKAEFLSEPAQ